MAARRFLLIVSKLAGTLNSHPGNIQTVFDRFSGAQRR